MMSIHTRLLLLGLLFTAAVLLNILSLVYLARSVSDALKVIEQVRQRQLVAMQMNAHLRDAEAALYRYQIEGEAGFAIQFRDRIDDFTADVNQYQHLADDETSRERARSLIQAKTRAISLGDQIIGLRDEQVDNLASLVAVQGEMSELLTEIAADGSSDAAYQTAVEGMHESSRAVLTSVTGYLASPDEDARVKFTEAAVRVQQYASLFETTASTPRQREWSDHLNTLMTEMQILGSHLISDRDLQQSLFANFIAIIFNAGEQTIVEKINPYEANQMAIAQQSLQQTVDLTITISILAPLVVTAIAGWLVYRMSSQLDTNVHALLYGAERVAAGNLTHPVAVSGADELTRLASSFNRMMFELANREERLRALVSTMAQIQDEERRLIGLDLHDGLTQIIISANMHLNALAAASSTKLNANALQELDVSRTLVKQAIDEARRVIAELRPTVIEDFGLQDGLRRYAIEVCESHHWQCEIITRIEELDVKPPVDAAIFRIAQEALANVQKHSQTERVRVSLTVEQDHLLLSIQDWGLGFDLSGFIDDVSHLGLVSMRERTEMLGGTCSIESAPGKGTHVRIMIPVAELAERIAHE